ERSLGIGLRAVLLRRLPGSLAAPPLDQLALNVGLSLASYGLLRRLRLDRGLAALLVALATLMVSVLLVGGRLRVTPDLPALSLGFPGAVTALLATDVLRQNLRRRLSPPAYEWAGALLSALLLLGGLLAFQALTGYTGVYPLMARLGPALSWALVLPL